MTDFIKDFMVMVSIYYSEAADSVFNRYTEFKALILDSGCDNT